MNKQVINAAKISAVGILNLMSGYGFAYLLPTVLAVALNLTKGAVNNPDGETFMFFGWLILAAMIAALVAFVVLSIVTVKNLKFKGLILTVLLALMVAGFTLCAIHNQIYYARLFKDICSLLNS